MTDFVERTLASTQQHDRLSGPPIRVQMRTGEHEFPPFFAWSERPTDKGRWRSYPRDPDGQEAEVSVAQPATWA
jgi:hypothetical protein